MALHVSFTIDFRGFYSVCWLFHCSMDSLAGTLGGATLGSIALAGSPTSHLTAGLLMTGRKLWYCTSKLTLDSILDIIRSLKVGFSYSAQSVISTLSCSWKVLNGATRESTVLRYPSWIFVIEGNYSSVSAKLCLCTKNFFHLLFFSCKLSQHIFKSTATSENFVIPWILEIERRGSI